METEKPKWNDDLKARAKRLDESCFWLKMVDELELIKDKKQLEFY